MDAAIGFSGLQPVNQADNQGNNPPFNETINAIIGDLGIFQQSGLEEENTPTC
jgi:hypothetical protein